MKLTATFAILGSAALSMVAAQTGSFTNFTNIATTPTQFTATSVSLSPIPLCVQNPTCLTLTGTLSTPIIQGAKNSVTGRWVNRLVYTDNQDLCAVLAANGTPCPIAAGAITLNLCHPLRSMTPRNFPIIYQYIITNGDGGLLLAQRANTSLSANDCP